MEKEVEDVALFDMDGTLCDYDGAMNSDMEKLRSPDEEKWDGEIHMSSSAPNYIKARLDLIRKTSDWWANLPKFKLGWDVLQIVKDTGFRIVILTQGPRENPNAWSGKKMWIDKNLGEDTDILITRDKGLVYGRILVDDFPKYIERWLEWRPRGLVIMPANERNKEFRHPQVIRYDGTNISEVREAIQKVKRN